MADKKINLSEEEKLANIEFWKKYWKAVIKFEELFALADPPEDESSRMRSSQRTLASLSDPTSDRYVYWSTAYHPEIDETEIESDAFDAIMRDREEEANDRAEEFRLRPMGREGTDDMTESRNKNLTEMPFKISKDFSDISFSGEPNVSILDPNEGGEGDPDEPRGPPDDLGGPDFGGPGGRPQDPPQGGQRIPAPGDLPWPPPFPNPEGGEWPTERPSWLGGGRPPPPKPPPAAPKRIDPAAPAKLPWLDESTAHLFESPEDDVDDFYDLPPGTVRDGTAWPRPPPPRFGRPPPPKEHLPWPPPFPNPAGGEWPAERPSWLGRNWRTPPPGEGRWGEEAPITKRLPRPAPAEVPGGRWLELDEPEEKDMVPPPPTGRFGESIDLETESLSLSEMISIEEDE